ncbi:hypothetical protein [Clostridium ganghwense]|uniref:DUF1540 domain-containing protein n=1 Tax=Clostridium ganghwense TaxID=312089 RepID=A0ABT4CUN2_9CLOT|nr:hypothetical protein [Clostridium ganghwense]MCY6372784.1 hypothetical protein [Clostridium ganghwense]
MNDIRETQQPMEAQTVGSSVSNQKIISEMANAPMATNQQTMSVAKNCPGYKAINQQHSLNSSCASAVSCNTCQNFQNSACQIEMFDKVLAGLDER